MVDERDLYQEIELELAGAVAGADSGGRGFLAFALMLFSLSLLSLAVVGGWIVLSEQGVVPSVAVLLNGTPTPTATPTQLPTPLPTSTPLPVPTVEPTADLSSAENTAATDGSDANGAGAVVNAAAEPTATATPPPTPTTIPSPTPTPTPTPLPWPPEVGRPVSVEPSVAGLTLEQIGGENPLRVLAELGHSGNTYLREMQIVRAQTPGYLNDTSVQAEQLLLGSLPPDPLYLIVGVMEGAADFNGQTGLVRMKVPWSETLVEVNLSSALIQQVSNPSLVLNAWPSEGGWLWMLVRSAELDRGMTACRNALPSRSIFGMPDGEQDCALLQNLLTTNVQMDAVTVMGIERDGSTMRELLPLPTTDITRRWIYADLGRHGVQLRTPAWLTEVLTFSDARQNFGLLRGTWDTETFELSADMVLDADTVDGVTTYVLHWKAEQTVTE